MVKLVLDALKLIPSSRARGRIFWRFLTRPTAGLESSRDVITALLSLLFWFIRRRICLPTRLKICID